MPKVSVIIPVYNVEKYLPKCLGSLLEQTLSDIEIICIDDGSTDSSCAILADFMQRCDRIKLIRQENGGPSIARNAGFDIATGEYVYFLDSDDYLEPQALERMYNAAAPRQLDVLLFNSKPVNAEESLAEINKKEAARYDRPKDYSGLCSGQEMFQRTFPDGKHFPPAWVYLLRRDFLLEQGLRFYPDVLSEDIPYVFQFMMLAQRVDYIPDQLHVRVVRENSITTMDKTIRHLEGYAVGYAQILDFVERHPLQENTAVLIDDYLYYAFWLNLVRLWNLMPEEERNKKLRHGGVVAAHLVALLKHDQQLAKEAAVRADRLQQRVEVLTQQRDRLQQRIEVLTQQRDRLQQRQLKRSPVARLKNLLRAFLQKIKKPR